MNKSLFSFLKSVKASIAVEFAICIPLLITAFLGMWDLINYCMAQARAQNRAMFVAQMMTDPKFCLTYYSNFYKVFGDYHQATSTFGPEQILSVLNGAEESAKYTYFATFDGQAYEGSIKRAVYLVLEGNKNGAGEVKYIGSGFRNGTVRPTINITVTYAISTPFLKFAFPSSVQATAHAYPITGQLSCKPMVEL